MTGKEAKEAIDILKAQGDTEEEILAASYLMFADDKMSIKDLEIICDALGYEMTEEFKNMSPEDQKTKGYEKIEVETEYQEIKGFEKEGGNE